MKIKALENRVNNIKQELDYIIADCLQGKKGEAKTRVDIIEAKLDDLWKAIHKFEG